MLGAVLVLGGATFTAGAEDKGDNLGEIASAYLYAADFVAQFRQSRCGKLATVETKTAEQVLDDVSPYVTSADLAELKSFLTSQALRDARRDNRELFEGWYQSFDEGLAPRTRCEVMARNVEKVYRRSHQKWERAKRAHTRRRN